MLPLLFMIVSQGLAIVTEKEKKHNIDSSNLAVLNSNIQVQNLNIYLSGDNGDILKSIMAQNTGNCSLRGVNEKRLTDLIEKLEKQVVSQPATDCSDLYKGGSRMSGVYAVHPLKGGTVSVYCDMNTDGGGWTVFQRRRDGTVNFFRDWAEYKKGFGNLAGEFWLGNEIISKLSNQGRYSLRIDLTDTDGNISHAIYDYFAVGSEKTKYVLSVGNYSGNAGNALTSRRCFSTKDQDNDNWRGVHCAQKWQGGWWYGQCFHRSLNGIYGSIYRPQDSLSWVQFRGASYVTLRGVNLFLKKTEMKMRPVDH